MSLQEALDRVEKLKRLSHSSNPHEAALAAMRLKGFDVETARAPREDLLKDTTTQEENPNSDKPIEILEDFPEVPYETMDEIEARQSADKAKVNWDELHFELIKKAQIMDADALIHIGQMGLLHNIQIDRFVENIFNFPTLAEAYRVAALDIAKQRHQ